MNRLTLLCLVLAAGGAAAQGDDAEILRLLGDPAPRERKASRLPPGPVWGAMPMRPRDANAVFATSDGCAICHEASPSARAMRTGEGEDVSPFSLWQGTLMANAFRDPYFRAALAREIAAAPEREGAILETCLPCHAPMAHHTARLSGLPLPSLADLEWDPLARDGVSCTVCHQARPDGLGAPESFDGRLDIRPGRIVYGPYPEPVAGFMRNDTAFEPVHGPHLGSSALCGSCHTLTTVEPSSGAHFLEQAPYLEWRNSAFTTEGAAGPEARSCLDCHMPDHGALRIARSPSGGDYLIPPRPRYRGHAFYGSNAFMLDLLAENAEELGVSAGKDALRRLASGTRGFLAAASARLAVEGARREGGRLRFDVRIENLSGHKLPTGYPSRRVWLALTVRSGERVVFRSGAPGEDGRLAGPAVLRGTPHKDRIETEGDVLVYEAVPLDRSGAPTTLLTAMTALEKDNRLLPRGWRPDGPHAAATAPVAIGDDRDFGPGGDVVHCDIPLAGDAGRALAIDVDLLFEAIPASWVEPLRGAAEEDVARFVRLYDAAPAAPERLAQTTAEVP